MQSNDPLNVLVVGLGSGSGGLGLLVGENLAGKIEHGQWQRDADGGGSGQDGKVPAHYQTEETESTSAPKKERNVLDIGCSLGVGNGKVSGGNEGKESDKSEEGEDKGNVDAEGTNEEDEADEGPARESC